MALRRGVVRQGRKGDRVYTPAWCADDMVRFFRPAGVVLEPCRGDGAIYGYLPAGSHWCEIDEGRDFFAWTEPVDWVITNPPYSKLRPFMIHAFRLSANVVLLIPARNLFSGYGTIRKAVAFGGMKHLRWYGTGAKLGFPMGNAIVAVHWERDYEGPTQQTFYEDDHGVEQHRGLFCSSPQGIADNATSPPAL